MATISTDGRLCYVFGGWEETSGKSRMKSTAVIACGAVVLLSASGVGAVAEDGARLSSHDREIYHAAFAAAQDGKWPHALQLTGKGKDPLPAKIIQWLYLRHSGTEAEFAEIAAFIKTNSEWPGLKELRRRAEEAISPSAPPGDALGWLDKHPPFTTAGRIALAAALLQVGRRKDARKLLRRTWVDDNFFRGHDGVFLRLYGKLLTRTDHSARLDRLLWDGKYRQAQRMLRRVGKGERALAIARIRLRRLSGGVDTAIQRVPKQLKSHPGLVYERLRWRRRMGRDEGVFKIPAFPPKDLVRPELWWRERNILSRRLLARGSVTDAYSLARDHRLKAGNTYAAAEWLAGWIALRFVGERREALDRFERLYAKVRYPISRARAAYWAGRAAEALGETKRSRTWFARAARLDATYYGQLAAGHLGGAPRSLADAPKPSRADQVEFGRHELVRAVHVLDELGQDKLINPFIQRLAGLSKDPVQQVLVGRLALAVGRPDLGVRVARRAYRHGIQLRSLAFPVIELPAVKPERVLLLAVARQESSFETFARSHAGALGVMQLMPSTARAVSRTLKIRYSKARLTSDPKYNLRLGSAYLTSLLDRYDGSYLLSVAAYNAGPRSVDRWLSEIGDPRTTKIDAIDWIELIPYPETRNYIQRVIENLHVYRYRIGERGIIYSLEAELDY